MMLSIKGTFHNGVALPVEPITGRERQPVIITFLEDRLGETSPPAADRTSDTLGQLLEACQMDAGIEDLAHQHDHYLYGKPKKA